jgi:hypothetical protein
MIPPTAVPPGTETSLALQQGNGGYSGGEDTYIYRYGPSANHSTESDLRIGNKQGYAALLRFDLSAIPPGASVTRATLQLYASVWGGSNLAIGAHVITHTVGLAQTTWSDAQVGSPWAEAGCNSTVSDRRAAAESVVTTSGIRRWYSFDLTAAAQQWIAGALPNNGVLLRATTAAASNFRFYSAESSNVSARPKLVLTYRVNAGPR